MEDYVDNQWPKDSTGFLLVRVTLTSSQQTAIVRVRDRGYTERRQIIISCSY